MAEFKSKSDSSNKAKDEHNGLKERKVADQIISAHDYPTIGLEDNEYVVIDVERSMAGLVFIWAGVVVISVIMVVFCQVMIESLSRVETVFLMVLLGYFTVGVAIILGIVESNIYRKSCMIITNRRAFIKTQIGPFGSKTQVIDLENIEDVGVFRGGVLSSMFGYGEMRLSTELDESAYRLTYVKNPDSQAVEVRKTIYSVNGNGK